MRLRPLLLALVTVVLVAAPALPSLAADPLDTRAVDDYVEDYLERHGLPGATVAVVKDGEPVHEGGYGEDSGGRELTEDSRLRIASVSKSFTAFAVLLLVDQGLVELDDPVVEHLPELELDDERLGEITVRQLLSHTSGLTTPTIIPPAETLAEGVARTRDWQLSSDPGTTYAYSNANYWVAARLVEKVSGEPFDDYLARHVFDPLGMTRTENTTTSSTPVDDLPDGHVTAYGRAFSVAEPEQMDSGAGGMVSTAHDMARWLAMQQLGGRTADGTRLLSTSLVEESHAAQPGADGAGLGWMHSDGGTTPERISHSGVSPTFNAQQDLVPESGYAVVVLVNSFTPSREHAYELASGIIDLTEGEEPEVGLPVATFVDSALGVLTLATLAIGWWGTRRAGRWSERRREWPWWRFGLRLLPQLVVPALAVFLFLVAPALQDNSFTTANVFLLFPALMVLLVAGAAAGLAVTVARVVRRARVAQQRSSLPEASQCQDSAAY